MYGVGLSAAVATLTALKSISAMYFAFDGHGMTEANV